MRGGKLLPSLQKHEKEHQKISTFDLIEFLSSNSNHLLTANYQRNVFFEFVESAAC
jgi:hypothetical protein